MFCSNSEKLLTPAATTPDNAVPTAALTCNNFFDTSNATSPTFFNPSFNPSRFTVEVACSSFFMPFRADSPFAISTLNAL